MFKSKCLVLMTLSMVYLSACASAVGTSAPVTEAAATHAPANTPTTAPSPTSTPTPLPQVQAIAPDNLDNLTNVLMIGKGTLQGYALSPDESQLLLTTQAGFYFLNPQTLEILEFINLPVKGTPAWSPDGSTIAWVGLDRQIEEVRLLNLETRQISVLYRGVNNEWLYNLAWSSDAEKLSFFSDIYGRGRSIRILDKDGASLLNGTVRDFASGFAWAPNLDLLANLASAPSGSSIVQIWKPGWMVPIQTMYPPESAYLGELAWSNNAMKISALSPEPGQLFVWSVENGELLLSVQFEGLELTKHSWAPDDSHVLVQSVEGDLWQLDVNTGDYTQVQPAAALPESAFSLSLTSDTIYSLEGGSLRSLNVLTGEKEGQFSGLDLFGWNSSERESMSLSRVDLLRQERLLRTVAEFTNPFIWVEGENGEWVAQAIDKPDITRYWNLDTGEEEFNKDAPPAQSQGWQGPVGRYGYMDSSGRPIVHGEGDEWISPDKAFTIAAAPEGQLLVKNAEGETLHVLTVTKLGIQVVAGSPDGKLLATLGRDGILKIWNIESGEIQSYVGIPVQGGSTLTWSPDSQKVAFFSVSPEVVSIYHAVEQSITPVQYGKGAPFADPASVSWSPNSDMLAVAGYNGIELLDASNGRLLSLLSDQEVWSDDVYLNWFGDGAWLAFSSPEGTLNFWGLQAP